MSSSVNASVNPFAVLLERSPTRELHSVHRQNRDATQLALLRDESIPLLCDPILSEIVANDPADLSLDQRHNLTIWTRPTPQVRDLVVHIQDRLKEAIGEAKGIWFPIPEAQHMTVFEITNGQDADTLNSVLSIMKPSIHALSTLPADPIILDTPAINFDVSGIALSFLPRDDAYLNLRAEMWDNVVQGAGFKVNMRYAFPSAHITVGRFVDGGLGMSRGSWIELLEKLRGEVAQWEGEWHLDGLELRAGKSWYGGGITVNSLNVDTIAPF